MHCLVDLLLLWNSILLPFYQCIKFPCGFLSTVSVLEFSGAPNVKTITSLISGENCFVLKMFSSFIRCVKQNHHLSGNIFHTLLCCSTDHKYFFSGVINKTSMWSQVKDLKDGLDLLTALTSEAWIICFELVCSTTEPAAEGVGLVTAPNVSILTSLDWW